VTLSCVMHGTDWSAGLQQPPDYTPPPAVHGAVCVLAGGGAAGQQWLRPVATHPSGGGAYKMLRLRPLTVGNWLAIGRSG
jgi:hypothetical protein